MASKSAQIGLAGPDDKDWQAESDLRTLIDAEKIKADPARLKAAMAKQGELKKALKSMEAKS